MSLAGPRSTSTPTSAPPTQVSPSPAGLQGLRVVSFESRRSSEMGKLIERQGAMWTAAPSLRELPQDDHSQVLAFADELLGGRVDVVVLLTGVGTRMMIEAVGAVKAAGGREGFLDALRGCVTVARGPKPVAVLREHGLKPTHVVPEPNTWEDLLATLDRECPVLGKRVVVQEYGDSNPRLLSGLAQRGAQVQAVSVYRWALPEDLAPLRGAIAAIIAGEMDVAVFTSAQQLRHVLQVAAGDGREPELRAALRRVLIASIGPVASEAIAEAGLAVDFEPDAPHMAELVKEVARRGRALLEKKRASADAGVDTHRWRRIDAVWPSNRAAAAAAPITASTASEGVFLRAARRQSVPHTPVWIMRQAGRYQRAYRDVRAKVSMLELCKRPDLMAEVTLMAVDRLGVDAAIVFADILPILEPLGFHLDYVKGDGPVIANPVTDRKGVLALPQPDLAPLTPVFDAVRLTRRALRPDIALIGFAGAPFTVASYAIEGGKSTHYARTKQLMYRDATAWHTLLGKLAELTARYLIAQIDAGADAVQLFDSWAGSLSPHDYERFVLPHVQALFARVRRERPGAVVIHFATGNPALLPLLKRALVGGDGPTPASRPGDVVGLDWRCELGAGWDTLDAAPGGEVSVMGNLDPCALYASGNELREAVAHVLAQARGRRGHIFNLGHGVLPDMDPARVGDLVDAVHELSAAAPAL